MPMTFNGQVGDVKSGQKSSVVVSKTYKGRGSKVAFEKFIKAEAKRQGIEILGFDGVKVNGAEIEATVRFKSFKGIL